MIQQEAAVRGPTRGIVDLVGSDEALLFSNDDGKTFTRLAYKPTAKGDFSAAIEHAGAVYVGGPWQDLVRVE